MIKLEVKASDYLTEGKGYLERNLFIPAGNALSHAWAYYAKIEDLDKMHECDKLLCRISEREGHNLQDYHDKGSRFLNEILKYAREQFETMNKHGGMGKNPFSDRDIDSLR
ncbi:MAG: hypothetical protein AABX03_00645 [Nanoarchaeota archaeon]